MILKATEEATTIQNNQSILELSCDDVRTFFLKQESYCSIELPPYFCFDDLLIGISKVLENKNLCELQKQSPRDCENVNHLILKNKDGRHGWRPLQLIHPAIYVSLVNKITEKDNWELIRNRFVEFAKNKQIKCHSLPIKSLINQKDKAEQISHWWKLVEQASIELALDYEFIIHSDITDCYSAIYTHSISWAIHTKRVAKKKENRKNFNLIGIVIDDHIQNMRHGQTNGIPQGSVLMDFIAEIVLGYADIELGEKISGENIKDYRILRYRDDYRIFTNNSQDGDKILKCLTEVMIDLGLHLNSQKTKSSNRIICSSIKEDKLDWMFRRQSDENLQKYLLIIHNHSLVHPNSGSLDKALDSYFKIIVPLSQYDHAISLISIVVDIAYHNPRTYPISVGILSKLITFLKTKEDQYAIIEKIKRKFSQIPNTGHMLLWLQRISLDYTQAIDFDEPLCRLVHGENEKIWNSDWISSMKLKKAIDAKTIINQQVLQNLPPIISRVEFAIFKEYS